MREVQRHGIIFHLMTSLHNTCQRDAKFSSCWVGLRSYRFLTVKTVNSRRSQHKDMIVFLDETESVKSPKGRWIGSLQFQERERLINVAQVITY